MNYKSPALVLFLLLFNFSLSQEKILNISGTNIEDETIISKYKYENKHETLKQLIEEVSKFQQKLKTSGYINNNLKNLIKNNDSIYLAKIELKNKIENLIVKLDSNIIKQYYFSKLNLKTNKDNTIIIPYSKIETELLRYNKIIASSGYPFSSLKLTDIIKTNQNTLTAKLIVSVDDKKRGLDKIIIKAYEKFPKSFLKRFLKITTNSTFNKEAINKKTKALKNLNFARQSKSPEILFSKDSTHLYLYLEKMSSNNFDGYIGFTTNENTDKLEFNGYLDLMLNNNLNYGETLHLNYKSDESDQKNFNLTTSLPYIFSSPIGLEASLQILKRDSTFINTKQKVNFYFQVNDANRVYAGITATESSNLLTNDNITNITDFNSNIYTLRHQYQTLQNEDKIFKTKTNLNLEIGVGSRNTSVKKTKQTNFNLTGNHIFNLNQTNSIYLKTIIQRLESDNYFENELYRFGGINTIRGFTENSLTANTVNILISEYRYRLSEGLFVNSVLDYANFENKLLNQDENLFGFGFGFGVLTNSGLLRFIYANGKTENEKVKFSNSKIHLSLTANF
ncbi:hypothetical protein BFP78_12800 [Gaetbulibacter sp. 5U11]|nr:hypothetical protein BFP78_12800 [Gaetbulibacter sp. 5U11]